MKRTHVGTALVVLLAVFALASCDTGIFQGSRSASVGFDFQLTAAIAQSLTGDRASTSAAEPITGTMTAQRVGSTDPAEVFTWFASIDEDVFDVVSTKTIILSPGDYDFTLQLVKSSTNHVYYGTATGQTIIDGTNDIALTLQPVIGATDIGTNLIEVTSISLNYPAIAVSALTAPTVRVDILNPAASVTLALNTGTGASVSTLLIVSDAIIDELLLFDDQLQVGKSVDSQEGVVVTAGVDIDMDLVPLYGETTFDLNLATGNATFNFTIPPEVIDEVGGDPANLSAQFRVVGPVPPLHPVALPEFSLATDGSYVSSVTLSGFEYLDDVDLILNFYEIATMFSLGSSILEGIALDASAHSHTWDLELTRRSLIAGSVFAVLGINVFDDANLPVAGAVIRVDGEIKGNTGDGTFGTTGYLKLYLPASPTTGYFIAAESGTMTGSSVVHLTPLEIENVDILIAP